MANNDRSEWILLDTDLTTRLAILPAARSSLYLEFCEPGSGELRIPLDSNAAAIIESGMFCLLYYRGDARTGFLVENIKEVEVDTEEEAGRWLSISGRGPLALLEDAIVWSDGTDATTRDFGDVTKASMLVDLIDEAQARGALQNFDIDFDGTNDSDSNAWSDSESYKLNVGDTLLDVLRDFAANGIEFDINLVNGEFILSAYDGQIGSDKSDTVFFRTGVNCEEVSRDERGDEIRNAGLVKYRDGYTAVSDPTSITNRRRRETLINADVAQTPSSASTFGSAKIATIKDPLRSISVKVWDGVPPRLFLDYGMGDTISLDVKGDETTYRVLGIQADFDGDNFSNVVVEFNTILRDRQLQIDADLNDLIHRWNSARDGELVEVAFWGSLGLNQSSNEVHKLLLVGDYIYVAGSGSLIPNLGVRGIARYHIPLQAWSVITEINEPPVLEILAICFEGTDIYVSGDDGGTHSYIAKYDSDFDSWSTIGIIEDDNVDANRRGVRAVVAFDGKIFVGGGGLVEIDGPFGGPAIPIDQHVASFDLGTVEWASVGGPDSDVDGCTSLIVFNNELYGGFYGATITDEGLQKLDTGAWVSVPISNIANQSVEAMALYDTGLVIGSETDIVLWDGVSAGGTTIGTVSGGGARVKGFYVHLNDIYVAGDFTSINGVPGFNGIAKYSGGNWFKLGNAPNTGLGGGTGASVVYHDNKVIIGGDFDFAGGKAIKNLVTYITDFQDMVDHLGGSNNDFDMAAAIHGAAESALSDSDEMGFWEDVSGNLRKITWANIKNTLASIFVRLTTNQTIAGIKTFTNQILAMPSTPGDGAIYAETHGDAYPLDSEQYTENDNVTSPTHFLYRETSGNGNITSPMIEGLQSASGAGTITGPFVDLSDDTTGKFYRVDKDGNVNIPTGSEYRVNGTAHQHDTRYPRKHPGKTAAPTVDNDTTEGYVVGDLWIDETNDVAYVALDVTDGAAVWQEIGEGGGGGSGTAVIDDLTSQIPAASDHYDLAGEASGAVMLFWNGVYQGPDFFTMDVDDLGLTTGFSPVAGDTLVAIYGVGELATISTEDPDAIHTDEAGEINGLTEKVTPVGNDVVVIEDSAASFAKKKAKVSSLGGGGGRTLIDSQTPTGTGTVTFSSIPGTYKKLILEYMARGTQAAVTVTMSIRFNGDSTAANYRRAILVAFGASTVSAGGADDGVVDDSIIAASGPANNASYGVIEVPFYANTSFHKQTLARSGKRVDTSSTHQLTEVNTVNWEDASAITQIDLVLSAGNYGTGSQFNLYGEN